MSMTNKKNCLQELGELYWLVSMISFWGIFRNFEGPIYSEIQLSTPQRPFAFPCEASGSQHSTIASITHGNLRMWKKVGAFKEKKRGTSRKFNSSPLKIGLSKRKVVFKPPFFRGYVKFWGCKIGWFFWMIPSRELTYPPDKTCLKMSFLEGKLHDDSKS